MKARGPVSRSPRASAASLLKHQEDEDFTLAGAEGLKRLADQGTRPVHRDAVQLDRRRPHRVARRGAHHQQVARGDRPKAGIDLHLDPPAGAAYLPLLPNRSVPPTEGR